MADLSKIRLNGGTYNFKDAWARDNLQTATQVNSAITSALGDITEFTISVVSTLPTTGEQGTFYFVPNAGSGNNIYDEYVYVNNAWEKIGSTEIDLSNYLQKSEIAAWAKASTKPSYTASEVGAISSDAPAAAITTTDISNWNYAYNGYNTLQWNAITKELRCSKQGTMTTLFSRDDLNIPAATTVTQTLTSGTKIGEVNSTALYAPTAYDDTALAARVTALENIPWVTYYTGSSEPSSAQGSNGDIYLQTD